LLADAVRWPVYAVSTRSGARSVGAGFGAGFGGAVAAIGAGAGGLGSTRSMASVSTGKSTIETSGISVSPPSYSCVIAGGGGTRDAGRGGAALARGAAPAVGAAGAAGGAEKTLGAAGARGVETTVGAAGARGVETTVGAAAAGAAGRGGALGAFTTMVRAGGAGAVAATGIAGTMGVTGAGAATTLGTTGANVAGAATVTAIGGTATSCGCFGDEIGRQHLLGAARGERQRRLAKIVRKACDAARVAVQRRYCAGRENTVVVTLRGGNTVA